MKLLTEPSQAKPKTKPAEQSVRGVAGDLLKVIRHAVDEAGTTEVDSKAAPHGVRAVRRAPIAWDIPLAQIMTWQRWEQVNSDGRQVREQTSSGDFRSAPAKSRPPYNPFAAG